MAHAIKVRPAVAAKTATLDGRPFEHRTVAALGACYAELQREEKQFAERKAALQAEVRSRMVDGKLVTPSGTFRIEERRSLTWSVASLRLIFGRAWTSFVKADDAVLRERSKSDDLQAAQLGSAAQVKVIEAFTFK